MACGINIQLVVLLFTFLSLNTADAKQKPINIALSGKWKSTPLLLETSEFFAKESPDHFWRFVDHVADQGHDYFELASDEVKYEFILKYAENGLSPLQLSFLKFSLSLRAFSPAIQMFQQLAEQIPSTQSCSAFIEVNGAFSCDTNALSELLTSSLSRPPTPIYKFDHIYPGKTSAKKGTVVILYTELGTNEFKEFHPALAQLAKLGEITYCIRHFVKDVNPKSVRLSGYGVELAIKSTEYKAKDDTKVEGDSQGDSNDDEDDKEEVNGMVFSKLRELHPELKNELKELRNHLLDSATELMPFKVWQLQDLGYQAGQKIMSVSQSDSLQYLRDISQNFPTQARSLVRQSVTSEFKREVKRNQEAFERMGLAPGSSTFYLNGLSVDLETYDAFTLLDVMTSEASLVEGLHSFGYQGDRLQKLLQLDMREGSDQSYAVDIRHTAVQYLNDLSRDKVYRAWPNSVQDLLRPSFPGMLRHVAKNLFHLVFVVDPANADSKGLLKMAEAFVVHKAPLRMGLVFVCESDSTSDPVTGFSSPCVAFTRAFNFILMDQGSAATGLSFMTDVFQKLGQKELTSDAIINEFAMQYPGEDKDLVFGDNDDYDDVRKAGIDFVSRIGLTGLPQVLINGVPLDKEQVQMENFEESVVMEVLKQTQIIQTAVYKGEVSDSMDVLDWWMERDNVLPRLNSRILAPATNRLDFTGSMGDDLKKLTPIQAGRLDSRSLTTYVGDKMKYIMRKDEDSVRPVTLWAVADLETTEGRDFFYSAIKHLKTSNSMRLGLVLNPVETALDKNFINKAVQVALQNLPMAMAKSFVTKLVKEENVEELKKGTKTLRDLEVNGMDTDAYMKAFDAETTGNFLKIDQTFASRVLSLQAGERAVVTNGAVLGPLNKGEEMATEDFSLLEKVANNQGAGKIQEALSLFRGAKEGEKSSDAVMKVFNLLMSKSKQEKRHKVEHEGDIHSVIKLEADSSLPAFTVEAVVNPVSREAQKLASILLVIKEIANVNIRIYLNPLDKLSEMPLKSFYRYVLEPEVTFNSEGTLNDGPSARFLDMPQKSLLTLNMDTPESWLVEAVTSPYDLDNILLEEVERSVVADFELEYLLLEGHCHDATTMQPPRGLQFVLGTNNSVAVMDTIVMANLGYFQLKANPGLWHLRLREGRSNEIYNIESHEFTDTPDGSSDVIIAITSFKSKTIRVKVSKKPDKSDQSVLQDNAEEDGGLWNSFTNTFSGSTKSEEDKEDSTLNIFSVASGHLYERFLRIMMLSVLKNTQSKVKFWFLKNFLSPSFKDFIPYMAQEYGFEYELVQYKWPHWLNQQKEKQRIIWGYKILFLDVLFPLDVKKIIFVDADQIVRADLQELHDLDLGGAPYGYTPFCDSKREMDGFRFWNSGYWKSHLAGRKYHISALYVVDLKRFRRIAAGDRLRGQYQGLSQDPNSLANLDQDLPNNMIHQVSIKSLPQEWLYCETWCSESTKPQAKTIDLCNNPLTKEPKLKAAMRIVPEWKNYDYEVKVLWDDIYNTDTKSQIEYDPPEVSTQSENRRKAKEEL